MPCPMEPCWISETRAYSSDWPRSAIESPRNTDRLCWVVVTLAVDETVASLVPVMRTAIEEADSGQLSDIDMDRSSMISLTPSMVSGFASPLSHARHIRERGIARTFSDIQPVEDLPSGVFQRNSASRRSLRLFGSGTFGSCRPRDR
jgi:hypothetical protein